MVKSNTAIVVVAMLVGLIFTGLPCLEAQSPVTSPMMSPGVPIAMAPAPTTDCVTILTNVSDCLPFVQIGSNMTVPDKACCPEVAGLLDSNPKCLCELAGQAESFGVDIKRAYLLPNACKVEIPTVVATCIASGSPVSAPTPAGSESEAPGPAGSTAAGPTDESVAMTPAGNSGSNGASSTTVHDVSTFICLAVAIFIAYYF